MDEKKNKGNNQNVKQIKKISDKKLIYIVYDKDTDPSNIVELGQLNCKRDVFVRHIPHSLSMARRLATHSAILDGVRLSL